MTLIAPTLQAFFTDRLARQLQASPRTIASYRDTLRLLLGFAQEQAGKAPSALDWDDLDEPLIAAFLTPHRSAALGGSSRARPQPK
ncbi:MAG: site-specific integrase [Gaiellaceae bacterium]